MEAFPRPAQEEGGQVVRQVRDRPQVVGLVPEMAALVAAIQRATPADPLQRAKGLADAVERKLVLTNEDLSNLLGQSVSSWRDGREAYGYRFCRHNQGKQVLWTVKGAIY